MEQFQIDFIAVLLAAMTAFVIGGVWYSRHLFGGIYHRICKIERSRWRVSSLTIEFIAILVTSFMFAFLINLLKITTVTDGIFLGACLWIGFVVPLQCSKVIWEKTPIRAFFIDIAHRLFTFVSIGGIIGA